MSTPRKPSAIVHQPVAQLYDRFVASIKQRIRTAQIKAALAANAELVLHYWEIGRDILASQKHEGWGSKVIDRLAADLQREFPKLYERHHAYSLYCDSMRRLKPRTLPSFIPR